MKGGKITLKTMEDKIVIAIDIMDSGYYLKMKLFQ